MKPVCGTASKYDQLKVIIWICEMCNRIGVFHNCVAQLHAANLGAEQVKSQPKNGHSVPWSQPLSTQLKLIEWCMLIWKACVPKTVMVEL
jgi:hypothetical protein